ncbi:MAG: hypothetical protein PWQ70_2792 [Clostridiales bacterium]|nr:hypothetical protein [Clostridiales bacterium]
MQDKETSDLRYNDAKRGSFLSKLDKTFWYTVIDNVHAEDDVKFTFRDEKVIKV